ncbi:MAG: QueT transporter family protein [Firmicutes bacterium]|nr:QueT transporter family protein [Bacillota bacterium]HAL63576.1 transporter [Clostridiales bacterium]
MNKTTKHLTMGAMIAALYVILTLLSNAFGLSSGVIQLRISEALYALAIFTPSAVLGLFVGCLLSNIFVGGILIDVIFGSIATLIGAFFTYKLRKNPIYALIPPILSNAIIIPPILRFAYGIEGSIWYFALTVGIGELLSCGVLGYLLYLALKKYGNKL